MNQTKPIPRKNLLIEIFRFIAATVMLFHHTDVLGIERIAYGGWIFVEFFFILSGFFMTKHFNQFESKIPEKEAIQYTLKKLIRIAPYSTLGVFIGACCYLFSGTVTFDKGFRVLLDLPLNFLYLGGLGIVTINYNPPLWYLTGVMIAMPMLIIIMIKHKDLYRYFGSWIIPLIIYTVVFAIFGNIQYWEDKWQIVCILRAFTGLMLGSFAYNISKRMGCMEISRLGCIGISILDVCMFALLVYVTFKSSCLDLAMPCVFLSLVTIALALSGKCALQDYLPGWVGKLGSISTPLYCLHRPVFDMVKTFGGTLSGKQRLCISFAFSFGMSIVAMMFVDVVRLVRKPKL